MSLRYKVPQNVQREDQIIWFITLKQLIILLVTGGFSYILYVQMGKNYTLSQIESLLLFLPLIIGAAFAFLSIKGIPLGKFVLLLLEQSFFLPRKRFWQPNVSNFTSMTQNQALAEKEEEQALNEAVPEGKFKALAEIIDNKSSLKT